MALSVEDVIGAAEHILEDARAGGRGLTSIPEDTASIIEAAGRIATGSVEVIGPVVADVGPEASGALFVDLAFLLIALAIFDVLFILYVVTGYFRRLLGHVWVIGAPLGHAVDFVHNVAGGIDRWACYTFVLNAAKVILALAGAIGYLIHRFELVHIGGGTQTLPSGYHHLEIEVQQLLRDIHGINATLYGPHGLTHQHPSGLDPAATSLIHQVATIQSQISFLMHRNTALTGSMTKVEDELRSLKDRLEAALGHLHAVPGTSLTWDQLVNLIRHHEQQIDKLLHVHTTTLVQHDGQLHALSSLMPLTWAGPQGIANLRVLEDDLCPCEKGGGGGPGLGTPDLAGDAALILEALDVISDGL